MVGRLLIVSRVGHTRLFVTMSEKILMHPPTVIHGVRVALSVTLLAALSAIGSACAPETKATGSGDGRATGCTEDKDHDGYGVGCALGADCNDEDPNITAQCRECLANEPGCACANEGKRIECGKLISKEGDIATCSMGGQLCKDGHWSACEPGAYAPGHDGYLTFKTLGKPGAAGSCQDCDPNCHLFTDSLDGLDAGADSGILPDGGIVFPNVGSSLPTPTEYATLDNVDGGFDGGIFHTLVPGQVSDTPDPVTVVDPRPAGGDVYFLVDDTSSMGPVAAALRDSIALQSGSPCIDDIDPVTNVKNGQKAPPGGGIVENLKCKFGSDVFIGLGRFEDYGEYIGAPTIPSSPYESLPYQHILSVQSDASPAQLAATFFGNTAYNGGPPNGPSLRTGGDIPESLVPALYAASSGAGFLRSGTSTFWVPDRSVWTTSWAATPLAPDLVVGGCPAGRSGYPCWRPQTTPIFVVMTDAPSHNGPGGQYGYPQYSPTWTTGAAYSAKANAAPNLNANPAVAKTFATANELEYETDASGTIGLKPRLYWGTVTPNFGTTPTDYPSYSSVSGGVLDYATNSNNGRKSVRDCTGTQTVTVSTTANGGSAVDFGNTDIPWPDAPDIRPNQTLACSGVTYSQSCSTAAPHANAAVGATYGTLYNGAGTLFNNIRLTVGSNTLVKADGATSGYESFTVPTIGSRVEFRITMLDDAQVSSPKASVLAGRASTGDLTLTTTAKSTPKSGVFYTTAANTEIRFSLRTTTPNVIVAIQYWVSLPTYSACSGFVSYTVSAVPSCVSCASGYTQSGSTCCGGDTPVCPANTLFAQSNVTGGCPDPGAAVPQAARTKSATTGQSWVIGNCFSCAAFPASTETNAPTYVRTVAGANPGCYVPSCATSFPWPPGRTTTAGGVNWSFASGSSIASKGSGKCVLPAAQLKCTAGVSPVCTSYPNLCDSFLPTYPVTLLSPPGGTTNTLCGCKQLNGAALEPDHPVIPSGAPTNGVLATYFRTSPAQNASYGWAVPQISTDAAPITRYESNVGLVTVPTVIPLTNFSARWTGKVRAPCTGIFQFTTNTGDGAHLWIDDNLVVNDPTIHSQYDFDYARNASFDAVSGGVYTGGLDANNPSVWQNAALTRFSMTLGSKYNMKMEMFQATGGYGALLRWRYLSGTCAAASNLNGNWQTVPSSMLTPDYDGVSTTNPTSRAQCLTQGSYQDVITTTKSKVLGSGGWNAESIYKFTVPAGKTFYYHFALIKNDATSSAATVSTTTSGAFLYLKSRAAALSGDDSVVVDCNKAASAFALTTAGVLAELNGKVDAGDYYLVVDNSSTTGVVSSYNYVLQVNQFDEAPPKSPTAPTYKQTIDRMTTMGARTIGVENSGVSCGEANLANFAQYDTRDQLEKLAFDTGSLDANGVPIVVSLKQNARSCGRDPVTGVAEAVINPPSSLTTKMNSAVNTLANTLRQDLVIRATKAGAAASPNIDPSNASFVAENFMADVTADATTAAGRCGSTPNNPTLLPTGPDFDPSFVSPNTREMFNACLPGAPVKFNVRFRVPSSIQRTNVPQYFRFDLVVSPVGKDASGNKIAGTPLARIPVVIKVPEANAGTASLVRDYDSKQACIPGQSTLWTGFGYNASTPDNIAGKDSNITFYFSTADDISGLAAPESAGETLLAKATRLNMDPNCTNILKPKAEVCSRVDLKKAMIAAGFVPNKRYTRIRIKLSASPDLTRAPTLIDWKMFLDCIDAE